MLIHPTFDFIQCSRPESRHASPNHHQPTIMLHDLMNMLRCNAFSNLTSWPIKLNVFIIVSLLEITHFQSSMVQFSYLWANLRRVKTYLRLKTEFKHCCICELLHKRIAALVHPIQPLLKHTSQWCLTTFTWKIQSCFVIADAVPSQAVVTKVTQRLFYQSTRNFGRPPLCLSISPSTSSLKCVTEDLLMPTKMTTLQVETLLLSCTKTWCFCS